MSNLDYPISVLIAKGKEISTALQQHGDDITKKKELLEGIKRAFCILNTIKLKEEMRKKKLLMKI